MNRPILASALFAFATVALCAQQQPAPYSGTSNPPPDQTIESTEPQQAQPLPKPNPGKPLDVQPAAPQVQPNITTPPASGTDPSDGTDAGMVQVAPSSAAAQPTVTVRASASDPDGDIVHPAPLPPGVIGEGSTIRVHLLDRLSTMDSQKGDAFRTRVASDVVEAGQVIIPTGAEIDGRIVDVSSGRIGGRGSMRLQPENVIMPNGTHFHLDAYVTGAPGARVKTDNEGTIGAEARIKRGAIEYGAAMGAGAITGAVLGGAPGAVAGTLIGAGAITVHLLLTHPQANLEPGTVLLFTLTRPLNLTPTNVASN